jgi:hypothetical protein
MAVEECLYLGNHTRSPSNPAAYQLWARDMRISHDQTLCPGCCLWVIWKPKANDGPLRRKESSYE